MITPPDVYRLYFHGPAYQVVGEAWRDDGERLGASPITSRRTGPPPEYPLLRLGRGWSCASRWQDCGRPVKRAGSPFPPTSTD